MAKEIHNSYYEYNQKKKIITIVGKLDQGKQDQETTKIIYPCACKKCENPLSSFDVTSVDKSNCPDLEEVFLIADKKCSICDLCCKLYVHKYYSTYKDSGDQREEEEERRKMEEKKRQEDSGYQVFVYHSENLNTSYDFLEIMKSCYDNNKLGKHLEISVLKNHKERYIEYIKGYTRIVEETKIRKEEIGNFRFYCPKKGGICKQGDRNLLENEEESWKKNKLFRKTVEFSKDYKNSLTDRSKMWKMNEGNESNISFKKDVGEKIKKKIADSQFKELYKYWMWKVKKPEEEEVEGEEEEENGEICVLDRIGAIYVCLIKITKWTFVYVGKADYGTCNRWFGSHHKTGTAHLSKAFSSRVSQIVDCLIRVTESEDRCLFVVGDYRMGDKKNSEKYWVNKYWELRDNDTIVVNQQTVTDGYSFTSFGTNKKR